jgi:hypothetical protein
VERPRRACADENRLHPPSMTSPRSSGR